MVSARALTSTVSEVEMESVTGNNAVSPTVRGKDLSVNFAKPLASTVMVYAPGGNCRSW